MFDIQSIFVYLGLALLSFFVAKYAELRNSRRAVWLIVIFLSLIAGLRAVSVGIDTKTYDMVFDLISRGRTEKIYGIENSFIYICAGLLRIWNNNQFLFFIFAFVANGLIIFRFWKDRECISFHWCVLSYYVTFFAFSLNGMRQFVAVAIVIYATGFLKEGKYIKFVLMILLASLFHISALIGVSYLIFDILFTRYFDKKRRMRVLLLCVIIGIVGIAIADSVLMRYIRYFGRSVPTVGLMMLVKIVMLLLTIYVIGKPQDEENRYIQQSYNWYYFVGLLLNSLSYFFLYTGRIGLYFYIFESLYIGKLLKAKNRTIWILFLKIGYIALMLCYLYEAFTKNAQGQLPYRFFWQS